MAAMKFGLLVCSIVVLAMIQANPGHGGERLALVTGDDYPPFADSRLPGGGAATVVVRHVVAIMGDEAAIEFLPWRRGYEEALRGHYDATFPHVRTPERERDFLYSDALFHVRQSVFMPAARRFDYRGPADLQGRRVCIALGYAAPAALQAMIAAQQVERVTPSSASACPALLASDRADFFIQDLRIGSALVQKTGLAREVVAVSDPPFGRSEIHLIVPRRRPDAAGLIARFNAALAKAHANGDYDRLLMQ